MSRTAEVTLNRPQTRFVKLPHKFRAFVAGFRGGKTWVGSTAMLERFLRHPGLPQGYFAPTYPLIRDIFYPTVEEVARSMGLRAVARESNKEVHVYSGRRYAGTVICRSMDKPASIVGYKIHHALVDEIDTMPIDKAGGAWNKVIARLSIKGPGLVNGADVTTTPEGFRFVYQRFFRDASASYGLVQASTRENAANLPADYISSLIETYTPELLDAYLDGQFVNLTSGSVYRNFDRAACASAETIRAGETLHIGQDFNVGKMASVVHVSRGPDEWHAVDELTDGLDTPALIATLAERYAGHPLVIYPDASGANTSSKSASESDLSLLRAAPRVTVRVKATNPLVRDRVLAMNTAFDKGTLRVNPYACPRYTEALEQQAYDRNGEPDKSGGLDHLLDAAGYFVAYTLPIRRPAVRPRELPH